MVLNSLFLVAPRALRGLSDFNVGQSWIINGLWDIPTPKSLGGFGNAALGGWEVGSIFRINNGTPTTAILNGDPMGLGERRRRPVRDSERSSGCDPVNHNFIGSSSPAYFNVSCFTLPTVSSSSPLASQCANFTGKECRLRLRGRFIAQISSAIQVAIGSSGRGLSIWISPC